MNNTIDYAVTEINILLSVCEEAGKKATIEEFIPEILALVDKFGDSGQSGGSAPYVTAEICRTLKQLLLQKPINPLSGLPQEFGEVAPDVLQNIRCSGVFREKGIDYYIDAISWKDQNNLYTGKAMLKDGTEISSKQRIRSYPFFPKTFVVDVRWDLVNEELYIVDENQLKEVFEYYDPPESYNLKIVS
jgi:hypothetical protein